METIYCNVEGLNPSIRSAMESVVGHPLRVDQKLVIQVLGGDQTGASGESSAGASELPDWCGVFTDLTPEEDAAISASIASRSPSREFPVIEP